MVCHQFGFVRVRGEDLFVDPQENEIIALGRRARDVKRVVAQLPFDRNQSAGYSRDERSGRNDNPAEKCKGRRDPVLVPGL